MISVVTRPGILELSSHLFSTISTQLLQVYVGDHVRSLLLFVGEGDDASCDHA